MKPTKISDLLYNKMGDTQYSQLLIDIVEEIYTELKEWNADQLGAKCYYLDNLLEVIKDGKDKELLKEVIEALDDI